MMAAAQAAAEAALQEAIARESAETGVSREQSRSEVDQFMNIDMSGYPQANHQGIGEAGLSLEAFQAQVTAAIAADEYNDQQHLLEDLMQYQQQGGVPEDVDVNSFLEMLAQQEQHNQLEAAEALLNARPDKHYFTVAQNGMILEATKTVTGIPPDALLMTSAYDSVYEEDLPGLRVVQEYFWDAGQPNVPVYLRRRTLEGDWIWLAAEVVSFVSQPIVGVILLETRVEDVELAVKVNRLTRIIAALVQAAKDAQVSAADALKAEEQKDGRGDGRNNPSLSQDGGGTSMQQPTEIPGVADDAAAYQAMRQRALNETGADLGNSSDPLLSIMQAAATGGTIPTNSNNANGNNPLAALEQEIMERVNNMRHTFDQFSVIEAVRAGIRLDLSMVPLSQAETKMITLFLSGRLSVADMGDLFLRIMQTGQDPSVALGSLFLGVEQASRSRSQHADMRAGPLGTPLVPPPPISVVNLSYTYIGNSGIEMLSEMIYMDNSCLKTIDISFCGIDEKGFSAFARALNKRKRKRGEPIRGLILSGNYIGERAARELGIALSPGQGQQRHRQIRRKHKMFNTGYDEDSESDSDGDDVDDDIFAGPAHKKRPKRLSSSMPGAGECCTKGQGLEVLHLGSTSMKSSSLKEFLRGLGPHCPIQEINLSSNDFGHAGAIALVEFLDRKGAITHPVMRFLDRIDMSNNNLGDQGTTELARAINRRSKEIHLVELRLSANSISPLGIETIMNKLLAHNLISLSLDKNAMGDQGCQLVAASLPSMRALSRLNLGFNQIGSRGVNSLMRSLIGCDSITYLGLSGNIIKISGAIALAFTLAQHPRLEELDLDNCCLSQAAQCHIIAGMISNRWVPMKRLNGFDAGPPMVAIGALDMYAQNLSNEECFRIRKDEQMKTILQWMESNRVARSNGLDGANMSADHEQFLTPRFVSNMNEVHGTPSQNAYLRLLGWLSRIPFDEDELTSLRKYFYDADGGEGDRGSDGYINLKLRGDLLAALDSDVADEIRENATIFLNEYKGSVGLNLHTLGEPQAKSDWRSLQGIHFDKAPTVEIVSDEDPDSGRVVSSVPSPGSDDDEMASNHRKKRVTSDLTHSRSDDMQYSSRQSMRSSVSDLSRQSIPRSESERSGGSMNSRRKKGGGLKARITMFPEFESKLEELKAAATDMIEQEYDPDQQEVILTQYAEASLIILRQLRYHCMNNGLDGWRQGRLKRKVLIVDDSVVTRKMVSRAFEKADFIVDTASNGKEGVEKLKRAIYDIAFMDIDMPVMNGFEATKALRQWEDAVRPGTRQPICALTAAYVDDFERSELMKFKEAGLDVMESKPCNIPRLFKVVDDVSPMFSELSISVGPLRENS